MNFTCNINDLSQDYRVQCQKRRRRDDRSSSQNRVPNGKLRKESARACAVSDHNGNRDQSALNTDWSFYFPTFEPCNRWRSRSCRATGEGAEHGWRTHTAMLNVAVSSSICQNSGGNGGPRQETSVGKGNRSARPLKKRWTITERIFSQSQSTSRGLGVDCAPNSIPSDVLSIPQPASGDSLWDAGGRYE